MNAKMITLSLVALFISPGVLAVPAEKRLNEIGVLKMMDADDDNMLSPVEHADGTARMFRAMDSDRDGNVTAAEMDAAMPEKGQNAVGLTFAMVDENGDGVLSTREHRRGTRKMFDRVDSDGDGFITIGEQKEGFAAVKDEPRD